jgi:hypothetical protein
MCVVGYTVLPRFAYVRSVTFTQRRNRLTTHFSERIPVVKRRLSLLISQVPVLLLTVRCSSSYSVSCCPHHNAKTIYKTKCITAEKYAMLITKNVNKLRRTSVGWWRNCATGRKVAGSIPDGVIGNV